MPPALAPRGAPPSFVPPLIAHLSLPSLLHPQRRQQTTAPTVPGNYGALYAGPEPGVVVGITLGSVAAFLLVLYLIYTCCAIGNPRYDTTAESTFGGSFITSRSATTHRRRRHRSHHSHSSPRRATVIVEEDRVEVEEPRLERIVVEERRRSVSRAPPPRVVRGSDVDSEDEVVVIEEHSPPRRRSRRRSSGERRESGYREVDPERYAGGDVPMREVRRSSRRRSESRR